MPGKIHSKAQMKFLFAEEARGGLPKGKAEEMAHAEGSKKLSHLPEHVGKAKGGEVHYAKGGMVTCPMCEHQFAFGGEIPEHDPEIDGPVEEGAQPPRPNRFEAHLLGKYNLVRPGTLGTTKYKKP